MEDMQDSWTQNKSSTDDTTTVHKWVHQLEEGIILIKNDRVVAMNQAAKQMLGITKQDFMDKPLIAVVKDHKLEASYLQQEELECSLHGKQLVAVPFSSGLILRDISKLKKTEENSRELLAVLSHELRTPVTVIRSTLEALMEDMPDNLRKRFQERALDESKRLVRLLEDLTVDVKPPQYRHIELKELVSRSVNLVSAVYMLHNVKLVQNVDDLVVRADEDKMLQVLINLLENAAIHGPDNSTVYLTIAHDELNKDYVTIKVQDEGTPLDPEEVEILFEPHSRGETVKTKGTGLGLYIVRNIALSFEGSAWAQPLTHGNEFGIRIPLNL